MLYFRTLTIYSIYNKISESLTFYTAFLSPISVHTLLLFTLKKREPAFRRVCTRFLTNLDFILRFGKMFEILFQYARVGLHVARIAISRLLPGENIMLGDFDFVPCSNDSLGNFIPSYSHLSTFQTLRDGIIVFFGIRISFQTLRDGIIEFFGMRITFQTLRDGIMCSSVLV